MPLRRCMAETSHRDYLLWRRHLEEPSPSDMYVMQLTAVVAGLFRDNVRASDYRLRFERRGDEPPMTPDEELREIRASQAAVMASTGFKRRG